jgi:putative two-component system response regulator
VRDAGKPQRGGTGQNRRRVKADGSTVRSIGENVKHNILIIDDDKIVHRHLAGLLSADNVLFHAYDGLEGIRRAKETPLDLILLDVNMPIMDGYETIQLIKSDAAIAHIPVIFLTGMYKPEGEIRGLSLGAIDYIEKPCDQHLLKKRIELRLVEDERKRTLLGYGDTLQKLVEEKTEKIIGIWDAVLSTMAEFVEFRDHVTGGHIERTRLYVGFLAGKMIKQGKYAAESAGWDVKHLGHASQMHDRGKVKISDEILCKPGKLTTEEFETMKLHTVYGKEAICRMAKHLNGNGEHLKTAAVIAHSHHERWDGTGYPLGLKGENIPLPGRLMAIADVYDALISERQYKKAFTHDDAVKTMLLGSGTQFDPVLMDIFEASAKDFHDISQANIGHGGE